MAEPFRSFTLKCCECGGDFIFSAGEQAFFAKRHLHTPRRCKSCRAMRNDASEIRGGVRSRAARASGEAGQ